MQVTEERLTVAARQHPHLRHRQYVRLVTRDGSTGPAIEEPTLRARN
jgi:hypothetical protein